MDINDFLGREQKGMSPEANPEPDIKIWQLAKDAALRVNWQESAACMGVDPDLFTSPIRSDMEQAKLVCAQCIVVEPCIENGIRTKSLGVWGGTTEKERKSIARRRRINGV